MGGRRKELLLEYSWSSPGCLAKSRGEPGGKGREDELDDVGIMAELGGRVILGDPLKGGRELSWRLDR